MTESTSPAKAYIDVEFVDLPRQVVAITELPFLIGRGQENGNHLSLDDMRISRRCAAVSAGASGYFIEDRGQREGIFVNGEPAQARWLANGDRIRLGNDDACQLVFRLSPEAIAQEKAEIRLRSIIGSIGNNSADELIGLKLLLEATSLMHSELPLESVLATMLDHAVLVTHADRGMLLEPDESGTLQVQLARGQNGKSLEPKEMNPSRSVLGRAIELETAVINEDLNLVNLQSAQSIMLQLLRSAVVIPLYSVPRRQSGSSTAVAPRQLMGAVYLDSKRTANFSALDRQILDALGAQAGSILENARLIEQERERQRLEQELSIAREIQQALIPQGLQDYPNFSISGMHRPCHEVGGDYFDVFPVPDGRIALLIADVSGKGLGAALVTTILQGALSGITLDVDPARVFDYLNRLLCSRSAIGRFVTIFFGLLDPSGTLEFIRAGHPSPLVMHQGVMSELYTGGSFPVGLVQEASYTSSIFQLEPGDTLLLYTDGITEAEDKSGELFLESRLQEAFEQYKDAPLKTLQEGILSAIENFAEGASQSDDITLLLVRYHGPDLQQTASWSPA